MRLFRNAALVPLVLVAAVAVCAAAAPPAATVPSPTRGTAQQDEQEKVWNSPEMLGARAWLDDYFAASAKITAKQAQQYLDRLRAMSPDQMKLWLSRFEEQRRSRERAETVRQQRRAEIAQSLAAQQRQQQTPAGGYGLALNGGALLVPQRIQSSRWVQNQMVPQRQALEPNAYYRYAWPFGY